MTDTTPELYSRRPWRTRLFGRPLATADAPQHTIGKRLGLAVFASDALSSTAYASQEILLVLAVAGTAAFAYAFPISIAITVLLLIVTTSYRQTIHAYPDGGGAYIVARDNLGPLAAQAAGAALLADYILTVSVSVSAGAAQLASAFPALYEHRVSLSISLVAFVTFVNLRGLRESGKVFAIPTYCFLAMMFVMLGAGFSRWLAGELGQVVDPPPLSMEGPLSALTWFVILHAFSNGTTALTGIEAISNGVTAFREPRGHNAAVTLGWMAAILATLFLGITFLAVEVGSIPSEQETVISQIARTALDGRGPLYLAVVTTTTLILMMAANTAFSGFPRLSAIQAGDGYLPRQLTYRGSRLVFSRGIVVLALASALLIVGFQASVSRLIPLYAIGVFLSFTLSQAGMTLRWRRLGRDLARAPRGWRWKMVLNGLGAVLTALVTCIFAATKFSEGAWLVLLVLPAFVLVFLAIRSHYQETAEQLSLQHYGAPPRTSRHRVILAISDVHRGTLEALRYARALSDDVTAVHVSVDAERSEKLRAKWELWGDGVRLVVLESPYRLLLEPLLDYITDVADERQPDEVLTIVVPQFVPRRSWHNILHAQTALFLRMALLFRRGIVITNVPYQLAE